MSVEIVAKIICDDCAAEMVGHTENSATWAKATLWDAQSKAKKAHWLFLPRYGKWRHLCQNCADKGTTILKPESNIKPTP